jgi:alkanesulfonate monooxygenase SsuD/methylene tetrahydromethanopterin reductase-like flavin-dependent oxidoreductase (luciferase family)
MARSCATATPASSRIPRRFIRFTTTANTSTLTLSICASRHHNVRRCFIRRAPLPKGRAFASAHAECVVIAAPTKRVLAPRVADLRKGAREAGRSASDLLIFTLLTVIVGCTDEEAQAKHAEYRSYVSHEGALALMAGWTSIAFAEYDLDEPIRYTKNDGIQSATEALTSADPDRPWTVREVAEFGGRSGGGRLA